MTDLANFIIGFITFICMYRHRHHYLSSRFEAQHINMFMYNSSRLYSILPLMRLRFQMYCMIGRALSCQNHCNKCKTVKDRMLWQEQQTFRPSAERAFLSNIHQSGRNDHVQVFYRGKERQGIQMIVQRLWTHTPPKTVMRMAMVGCTKSRVVKHLGSLVCGWDFTCKWGACSAVRKGRNF